MKSPHRLFLLLSLLVPAAACTDADPVPSKQEAAASGGKTDHGLDLCDLYGWYDDDVCDTFCPDPDPDCDDPSFCTRALCGPGTRCDEELDRCVDIAGQFCGGFGNLPCPDGFECIDDPDDDCNPDGGGTDCGGICVPEEPPQPQCGGFAGLPCPDGSVCVDDPADDCDPDSGGADCGGVCVPDASGEFCGGIGNLSCPAEFACLYDLTDGCDPINNNFDCGGSCLVCPSSSDPGVHYVATDPFCTAILFACEDDQSMFIGECGCGCIDN